MPETRTVQKLAPKSVLLVDDEPAVTNAVGLLLKYCGHSVEIAENSEKALAMYEKKKYDLVMVDFIMPGMNGLELARFVKERVPKQPIIVITAHAEAVSQDRNIDVVLGKPFSPQQLETVLSKLFVGV